MHVQHPLEAMGLAFAASLLWCCAGGVFGWWYPLMDEIDDALRAKRPELQNFSGFSEAEGRRHLKFRIKFMLCMPLEGLAFVVMMTVLYAFDGFGWQIVILWLVPIVACACCCYGRYCEKDEKRRIEKECCFFFWPWTMARLLGGDRLVAQMVASPLPRTGSLDRVILDTRQKTIVFEGRVVHGKNTVTSWPGKYESAWDDLVQRAKKDAISAAVVFLPEGSEHYGAHDQIPAADAQGLPPHLTGGCWCTPLYGESKPWGCRWWTKWTANVEFAVQNAATLEVYFFNSMVGKGKVQSFTTAGEEHLRRERILERMSEFKKSEVFLKARESGLENLSQQTGPDSSSPYGREERRLFLAWLPEEDRTFLKDSEGLGNSQKAEVTWLERKGYHYLEKEVNSLADLADLSPEGDR
ncbi:unnamed protein product [Symbiodinium natans]|uniref:Uncharacterized protein n=1 Tax=Symbiodinium natans TaxID=878477 RepID=A0A812GYJ1_9DINO|nr:unnamed protein product [Symbiodinium natans]